jgi:hypothetical protein
MAIEHLLVPVLSRRRKMVLNQYERLNICTLAVYFLCRFADLRIRSETSIFVLQ